MNRGKLIYAFEQRAGRLVKDWLATGKPGAGPSFDDLRARVVSAMVDSFDHGIAAATGQPPVPNPAKPAEAEAQP